MRRVNVLCVCVSARACPDCAELHVCSGNERCRQCARAAGVLAVSSPHACWHSWSLFELHACARALERARSRTLRARSTTGGEAASPRACGLTRRSQRCRRARAASKRSLCDLLANRRVRHERCCSPSATPCSGVACLAPVLQRCSGLRVLRVLRCSRGQALGLLKAEHRSTQVTGADYLKQGADESTPPESKINSDDEQVR